MAYLTGTLLASPVVNGSSGDTYGTHYSILGIGGYQEVLTIADRDAIPVNTINGLDADGLSSGRRRLGMLVYVSQPNITYQLNVPYGIWSVTGDTAKVNALANNSNWILYSTGSAGSGGGENVTKRITQLSHGFSVGQAVGFYSGAYNLAITDGTPYGSAIGMVSQVVDINTFDLTQSGYITGITGVSTGAVYYVSNITPGALTVTIPVAVGQVTQPIFAATASNAGWVLPYRPLEIVTGGTNSNIYTGASPAAITVGGINTGTPLTGKTYTELFEELLVPELCGTITAPSTSIGLSSSGTFEVGCVISQIVSGTFSRGSISPQYCSVSGFRSGCANAYAFSGVGMPVGFQSCVLTPGVQTNASYTILSGSQSWGVCTRYDAGSPALGSKGTQYSAALPSGCTAAVNASVTGLYPYYYGKVTSGSRPSVDNSLVVGGTKAVASSTGTVTVTFGSVGQWTWLAIPASSTSKTCWFVNSLDNGNINNAPSDKYPDECVLPITSAQACWAGISYKVYMSGFAATDANPIQFRNS